MDNIALDMAESICKINTPEQCRYAGKKSIFYFCGKDNNDLRDLIDLETKELEAKYGKDKKFVFSDNCSGYRVMRSTAIRS